MCIDSRLGFTGWQLDFRSEGVQRCPVVQTFPSAILEGAFGVINPCFGFRGLSSKFRPCYGFQRLHVGIIQRFGVRTV